MFVFCCWFELQILFFEHMGIKYKNVMNIHRGSNKKQKLLMDSQKYKLGEVKIAREEVFFNCEIQS